MGSSFRVVIVLCAWNPHIKITAGRSPLSAAQRHVEESRLPRILRSIQRQPWCVGRHQMALEIESRSAPFPSPGARRWHLTRALNTPGPVRSSRHKGVATLDRTSQTHARASALFNKKEEQQREGRKAMAEYEAAQQAMREKTARLRALRLARDAAGKQAPKDVSKQAPTPQARKRAAAGE